MDFGYSVNLIEEPSQSNVYWCLTCVMVGWFDPSGWSVASAYCGTGKMGRINFGECGQCNSCMTCHSGWKCLLDWEQT